MVHMRDERLITLLQQTSRWAGVAAIAVGCMVIVAWQFEVEMIKRVLPGQAAMNPLAAIAFILSGISLLLSHPRYVFSLVNPVRTVLACLIVGIGATRLLEIALNITIGLDQLLFTDRLASPAEPMPNHMPPNAALAFLFLGTSLALLGLRSRYNFLAAQSLALLVGAIALLTIVGYIFGASTLARVAHFMPIPLNTALLFLVMSLGVICARPESGLMHILTRTSTGGILARRLIIVAFAVPFALGTLWFAGERAGYYDTRLEMALFTVSTMVVFALFVLWTGNVIHRIDSERRRVEEEFRDLYNNAPCGYHSLGENGYFVQINNTELAWLGYARDEVVGVKRFLDVITPESQAVFYQNFPIFKEQGHIENVEFEMLRKDGTTFPALLTASAIKDAEGRFVQSRSTIFDITLRKQAMAAIKRLAAIVDSTDDAIVGKTLDGVITSWNRGAERIYGYTADEMVGRPIATLAPEGHKNEILANLSRIRSGERITYYQTRRQRKDGRVIDVSLTISPIMNERGEVVGAASITRDITEQKEAEERIRKLNEALEQQAAELQEINKQLEAFSYSVSHDLRAPLRAIDGFSKLLVEEYGKQLDEEGRRLLTVIQTNTRQMGQLIDDLLAFSRISRTELRGQEISMTKLVRAVADELLHRRPDRTVELALNDLPPAWGDPAMVKQVVVNLLSNAIKFTAPRGDAARIEIGGERNGDMCQYSVRDNGVGFDMRFAEKLFGVFQRLHSLKEFEGMGIGLAIVHRVVTRHGGMVTADSDPQRGTTFTFTLPSRSIS